MKPIIDKSTDKSLYVQGIEDTFEYLCCIVESLKIANNLLPKMEVDRMNEITEPFDKFFDNHKLFEEAFENHRHLLNLDGRVTDVIRSLIETKLK